MFYLTVFHFSSNLSITRLLIFLNISCLFVQKQQYRFYIITLVSIYQSSNLIQKTNPSKHTAVFEGEIQSHEVVKSLCESIAVMYLQICLI